MSPLFGVARLDGSRRSVVEGKKFSCLRVLVIERNFFVRPCAALSRRCVFVQHCQSEIPLRNVGDDEKKSALVFVFGY